MYRVLLERAAEKDLSRLASEIHDRLIAAIRGLAACPQRIPRAVGNVVVVQSGSHFGDDYASAAPRRRKKRSSMLELSEVG